MSDLRKKDKNVKTEEALQVLGKSYLMIPRSVCANLYAFDDMQSEMAWLHLTLLIRCNYAEGPVLFNRRTYTCRKGEYIGTYNRLSEYTRLTYSTVRRLLIVLKEQGLIEITRLRGGVAIYLYGYAEYTCPGRKNSVKEMVLSPYQTLLNYEEKIAKGIQC